MVRPIRRSRFRRAALVAFAAASLFAPLPALAAPPADSTVKVSGTSEGGLQLRQSPDLSSAIVTLVPEGTALVATGEGRVADGYEWAQLRYGGALGWGMTTYLVATATPAVAEQATATAAVPVGAAPSATSTLAIGATVTVSGTGGSLRLRSGADLDAPIVGYAPEGAAVTIAAGPQTDRAGDVWYSVGYNGPIGWVSERYLAVAGTPRGAVSSAAPGAASPVQATTTATAATTTAATGTTGNARGAAIAALGVRYLGVPYVWGGATPAGWDCSGFVLYILEQVTGQTPPRTTQAQIGFGTVVAAGDIRAGDLVFFANTYAAGITHVGIALGDGRFVHAGSPSAGTIITSLSDSYYASRFAGARRP